ncbi:hypothetical protein HGO21_03305 [Acinetobacter sp. CUI P1]|nr:hypothetical protein [Acinetobacter sp. CUI P1]
MLLDETVNDIYKKYILLPNEDSERLDFLRLNPIRTQNPPSAKQRLKEAHDFFRGKLALEFPDNMTQTIKDKKLLALTKTFTTLFTF